RRRPQLEQAHEPVNQPDDHLPTVLPVNIIPTTPETIPTGPFGRKKKIGVRPCCGSAAAPPEPAHTTDAPRTLRTRPRWVRLSRGAVAQPSPGSRSAPRKRGRVRSRLYRGAVAQQSPGSRSAPRGRSRAAHPGNAGGGRSRIYRGAVAQQSPGSRSAPRG